MHNIPKQFLDLANEFFNENTKKIGFNKRNEKCVRGFLLAEYELGGIRFEPIIYNLTLKK